MDIPWTYVLILIVFMIVILAKDLHIGEALALITATIAAILLISTTRREQLEAAPTSAPPAPQAAPSVKPITPPETLPEPMPWQQQNPIAYSRASQINQAQIDSYSTCYEPVRPVVAGGWDLDQSVDGGLAILAQKRARDRKAADGVALKDASFYRFYYDDELSLYENKPWWGRPEY